MESQPEPETKDSGAPFHGCYRAAEQLQLFERNAQSATHEIGVTDCVSDASNAPKSQSSSGLGHCPFTARTRIQIPAGTPLPEFYPALVAKIRARLVPDPEHPGCLVFPQKPGKHARIRFRSKLYSPHRVIAEWKAGSIAPRRYDAQHSCDNPPCANDRHVSIGTRRDNVMDAIARGLSRPPPARRVVTPEIEQRIRELRGAGRSLRATAAELGIGKATVWSVTERYRVRSAVDPSDPPRPPNARAPSLDDIRAWLADRRATRAASERP